MMLSAVEAQRLRAEVHAAMVARQYDLARTKLQELAQRSRGTWPGLAQAPHAAPLPAPGGRAGRGGGGRMTERTCRICGRVNPPGGSLPQRRCRMCYVYWRRHGVERPLHPPQRPVAPHARPCTQCGRLTPQLERGWCQACYMYWYRHGRERPPAMWQR
jgi:hypothetical protein